MNGRQINQINYKHSNPVKWWRFVCWRHEVRMFFFNFSSWIRAGIQKFQGVFSDEVCGQLALRKIWIYHTALRKRTASPFWRKHAPFFKEWNHLTYNMFNPASQMILVANLVKGKIRIFKSQWFHWLGTFHAHLIEVALIDVHSVLFFEWTDLNTYCPDLSLKHRHLAWFFGGV